MADVLDVLSRVIEANIPDGAAFILIIAESEDKGMKIGRISNLDETLTTVILDNIVTSIKKKLYENGVNIPPTAEA